MTTRATALGLRRTARAATFGRRVQRRRCARDNGGGEAKERKEERRPFRSPIYGGDSGAVPRFPAHDLHDRGWDLFCAARHVALAGALDPATPRVTRPPTVGLRIGCGSRRRNPSDSVLGQKHSSVFLLRRDVVWGPARNLEFNTKPTVEIH